MLFQPFKKSEKGGGKKSLGFGGLSPGDFLERQIRKRGKFNSKIN